MRTNREYEENPAKHPIVLKHELPCFEPNVLRLLIFCINKHLSSKHAHELENYTYTNIWVNFEAMHALKT